MFEIVSFPDGNVWVLLGYERHVHDVSARRSLERLARTSLPLLLPRQLKLLRLLNEPAVMGSDKAKSQRMPGGPAIAGSKVGLSTSWMNQVVSRPNFAGLDHKNTCWQTPKYARVCPVVITADLTYSASRPTGLVRSGPRLLHFGARGAPRAVPALLAKTNSRIIQLEAPRVNSSRDRPRNNESSASNSLFHLPPADWPPGSCEDSRAIRGRIVW